MMHLEILTEDSSTKSLLDIILPSMCMERFTYRVISYKGVGRVPPKLRSGQDPRKRILLDQIPRIIKGYDKTPGVDQVLVVLDTDTRVCTKFLAELKKMISDLGVKISVIFRLAIEETEAWYLGDKAAIKKAYPNAKLQHASDYEQDSVCGTWERLADVVYPGGSLAVEKIGWPLPGQLKHEWATRIAHHMDLDSNQSPSFQKLRVYILNVR